ncbi:MAG: hypothetical protein JSS31_17805 [Proteobacteria bacterium]|nr:hypothetical protein [Pseudomonadota bacterium]MBS0495755.1 hypothetical protein [Pseudomonadota bacterium]
MTPSFNLAQVASDDFYAKLNQLRESISFGVEHQSCANHQKVVNDFCALAVIYRLKIFDTTRSNKNINHPAKDVISAIDILVSKIDKFKNRNMWRHDCSENPHTPLDRFVFYHAGDGEILNSNELLKIRKKLELAFVEESKYDDDFFKKFIRVAFVNLLGDILKLTHNNELKINFSNETGAIDKRSLFFVFLKIFEFCEYEFYESKFEWLPWAREKITCKSLERLLLNRLDAIRGGKNKPGNPIKIPFYSDINSAEPCAFECIDTKGVGMVGDLCALHGYTEFDNVVIRGVLPDFSK